MQLSTLRLWVPRIPEEHEAELKRGVTFQSARPMPRAGNVTVRVDIFSQNASEIHEVIEALERRLKAVHVGFR